MQGGRGRGRQQRSAGYLGPLCLFHSIHHTELAILYEPNAIVCIKQAEDDQSSVVVSDVLEVVADSSGQRDTMAFFAYPIPYSASVLQYFTIRPLRYFQNKIELITQVLLYPGWFR